VDGESQITSSIKNKKIESLCLKAAALLGITGHAVFQLLSDAEGQLHVIECNPRFGGASTLSVAMGLHSFEWFMLESLKKPLPPFVRSKKERRQVRFSADEVFIQ
jgi:carbamoyl-phosphate synthase large subunit